MNLAFVGFIAAARSRILYDQCGLILKYRCLGSSEWSALHSLWKQILNPKLLVALDFGMKSHKKPESIVIRTAPLKRAAPVDDVAPSMEGHALMSLDEIYRPELLIVADEESWY